MNESFPSVVEAPSGEVLAGLLHHLPMGVAILRRGHFVYVNAELCRLVGYERDRLVGRRLADMTVDRAGSSPARLAAAIEAHEGVAPEAIAIRRTDGAEAWVLISGHPIELEGATHVLASFRDLSDPAPAEGEALNRQRQYEDLFNASEVAIWDADLSQVWHALEHLRREGVDDIVRHLRLHGPLSEALLGLMRLNDFNHAAARLFGVERGSALPAQPTTRVPALAAAFPAQVAALWQRAETLRCEIAVPVAGGTTFHGMLSMRMPASAEAARHAAVVLFDITERKAAEGRLAYLARFDSLTDLPNRATFAERLKEAMARTRRSGTSLAIHFLDLDRFKDVNDTLGHPAGDALLQLVGRRLQQVVRSTDTVARFGGDEFAVLQLDVTELTGVDLLASKLIHALNQPFDISGHRLSVSTSIGVTLYAHQIREAETLMAQADVALYRAKQEGRNRYKFHSDDMDREMRARFSMAAQLRQAIEEGRLELFYQPQFEIPGPRLIGLEALLRWRRNPGELLRPAAFLKIALETGLILPIGNWVLREACRQLQIWTQAGIAPPQLAVNISARQLRGESDFDTVLRSALRDFSIEPARLELELTESDLAEAGQGASDPIGELRRLGVGIAIDDFGTGYSSLGYLTSFRFTRLKIANQFVHDMLSNPANLTIVRAILRMTQELELQVIAEGVESQAQAELLASVGCRQMQGFHFGRPVPAREIEALLRAQTR